MGLDRPGESLIGTGYGPTTVYSEVEAGVWRIAPVKPSGQRPAFSLVSPLIGEDSALFDWITLRLRIIHDLPIEDGNLLITWSNGESRRRKKEAGLEAVRIGFSTVSYTHLTLPTILLV